MGAKLRGGDRRRAAGPHALRLCAALLERDVGGGALVRVCDDVRKRLEKKLLAALHDNCCAPRSAAPSNSARLRR